MFFFFMFFFSKIEKLVKCLNSQFEVIIPKKKKW